MRYQLTSVTVLAIVLCLVPAAAAQTQRVVPTLSTGWTVPPELDLPAGTLVTVRLTDTLSSDRNHPGEGFRAVLDQPLVSQGWVVSRRGQTVVGRVAVAQKAGRVQGVSQLAVELSQVALVDGGQVPVRTQLAQASAGTSVRRDAAGIGTTTGVGATIGAAAGGGVGAAIGAAAGAVAGMVGILTTRGRATELYPETVLTFRLEEPTTISTQRSSQAFRAVSAYDYNGFDGRSRAQRIVAVAESYPPHYRPYYYYPAYGYYGFYGYRPRVYVAPRVIIDGHPTHRYHR